MGKAPSKPKLTITYQEKLQQLQKCIAPCFFVLSLNLKYNRPIAERLLQPNNNATLFTSLQELQQFREDHKANVLVACLQNDVFLQNALPNAKAFQRIAFAHHNHIEDVGSAIKKLKRIYGYRFAGLFPFQVAAVQSFLGTKSFTRTVYFCDSDYGFINKALSNIYFFLGQQLDHPFSIFQEYLKFQGNQGTHLSAQIKLLMHENKRLGEYISNKMAEGNEVLTKAVHIFKSTFNPGVIAHVSWLYDQLQSFIRNSYKEQLPKLQITKIFIVAQLSREEIEAFRIDGNFMFSTFVLGFTSLAEAQAARKNNINCYIIIVSLNKQELQQNLANQDFGFCLFGKRAVFALQTFFTVKMLRREERQVETAYGILGKEYRFRRNQFRYLQRARQQNVNMLKFLDYLSYCKQVFLEDEVELLLHLEYYHKFTSELCRSNRPINQSMLKLADVAFALGNLELAESHYSNILPLELALLKKLYMYDRSGRAAAFSQTFSHLRSMAVTKGFQNPFVEIAFLSYDLVALAEQSKDEEVGYRLKQIEVKAFDELSSALIEKLKLHKVSIASMPLYNLVLRNCGRAYRALGQPAKAEEKESDYGYNWPFFDGTHVNWLP